MRIFRDPILDEIYIDLWNKRLSEAAKAVNHVGEFFVFNNFDYIKKESWDIYFDIEEVSLYCQNNMKICQIPMTILLKTTRIKHFKASELAFNYIPKPSIITTFPNSVKSNMMIDGNHTFNYLKATMDSYPCYEIKAIDMINNNFFCNEFSKLKYIQLNEINIIKKIIKNRKDVEKMDIFNDSFINSGSFVLFENSDYILEGG